MTIPETLAELAAVLRAGVSVDGSALRVVEIGVDVNPPALVMTPPVLAFDGYRPDPTDLKFTVALVVAANERSMARLYELLPLVTACVHDSTDAVVTAATPGTFKAGAADLPAYLIDVECPL